MKILIKGAGGHGVVVADIIRRMHSACMGVEPVGFIDDNPELWGRCIMGLKVYGSDFTMVRCEWNAIVVAIGDSRKRYEVFRAIEKRGTVFSTCVHPSAIIAGDVQIGTGAMICAGAVINPAARIGANAIVNTNCSVDHHNVIGDHAHIAPGATLGGEVHVGEGTLIGIGATVLPGCRIGSWSVIGGGAVVTEDIPDGVVCCGVPAKPIRKI